MLFLRCNGRITVIPSRLSDLYILHAKEKHIKREMFSVIIYRLENDFLFIVFRDYRESRIKIRIRVSNNCVLKTANAGQSRRP